MTTQEFSDMFDVLLNSHANKIIFGDQASSINIDLDEYEKSIFLTNAQEQIIIDTYSGRNSYEKSFEQTEEVRRYLSNLVNTYETSLPLITDKIRLTVGSVLYAIPKDTWFITYEIATLRDTSLGCLNGVQASVVPITQDELYKVLDNPFRGPGKERILRIDLKDNTVELVSKYSISSYKLGYIAKPSPIVLVDLPEEMSINGINTVSECKLNPAIHRAILERAVQLALISKTQLSGSK